MSDVLLVGLGNPGPKYAATRHNIGFMAVDAFADRHHLALTQQKFHGRYGAGLCGDAKVGLLEPETYMNLSGKSVQAAATFFRLSPGQIVVAHDDIDLELGRLKVKIGGGHGGHNGLRDITAKLGAEFVRIRLGVGRPDRGDVTSHVLGVFRADEMDAVNEMVERAADAVECILERGADAAQNEFNGK